MNISAKELNNPFPTNGVSNRELSPLPKRLVETLLNNGIANFRGMVSRGPEVMLEILTEGRIPIEEVLVLKHELKRHEFSLWFDEMIFYYVQRESAVAGAKMLWSMGIYTIKQLFEESSHKNLKGSEAKRHDQKRVILYVQWWLQKNYPEVLPRNHEAV